MNITQSLLDKLTAQAKESPRLRMNLDLRNSADDQSQRMINAIEPGSVVPIHRHRDTTETVVCLRGRIVEEYYDDLERICTDAIQVQPGGPVVAINIPAGQWHTLRSLESGTVIMEIKDGPYQPIGPEDILSDNPITTEPPIEPSSNLTERLRQFLDNEARSCSMDPACITPLYIYRMWGGQVALKDIEAALNEIKRSS